jgi:hypothetical protein
MLQTNYDRLYFFSIIAIHIGLCVSLASPLHFLSTLILPFRPLVIILSLVAFLASVLPIILLRKSEISSAGIASRSRREATQDVSIMGVTLRNGSPAAHYYAILSMPRTSLLIGLYALSGLLLAVVQATGLMLYSTDSDAWLPYQSVSFRNPQGHRVSSLRPNERLFFLLGSNLVLGAIYILYRSLSLSPTICDTASPHSAVVFEPQSTVKSLGSRLSGKMRRRLPRALLIGSTLPSLILVLYLAIRRSLFRLILSVIGHNSALRPILIPSFRHHFLSFGLVSRSIFLGIFSAVTWETINILWEVLSTQPFTDMTGGLSRFSREPTKCLIDGLQSRKAVSISTENAIGLLERQYLSHFAFAEASVLASTDYERRRAIFREVGSNNPNAVDGSSKSAWISIAQECIAVLQEERLYLATRWKQAPAAATTTTTSNTAPHLKAVDSSHQALVESGASVLKKRPVSIWDKLASPGAMPSSPPTASPATSTTTTSAAPSNDLSAILHRLAPTPVQSESVKATSTAKTLPTSTSKSQTSAIYTLTSILLMSVIGVLKTTYLLLPPDLRHVLTRSPLVTLFTTANKKLLTPTSHMLLYTGTLPQEAALATWSIQILGALLSASVDQDEYGTVALSSQHKLGVDDVLDEIASLLLALKQWGQEIAIEMQDESQVSKHKMTMLWDRRVAPIVVASRNAIQLVLGAFEPTGYQIRQEVREKIDKAMSA